MRPLSRYETDTAGMDVRHRLGCRLRAARARDPRPHARVGRDGVRWTDVERLGWRARLATLPSSRHVSRRDGRRSGRLVTLASASRLSCSSRHAGQPSRCARRPGTAASASRRPARARRSGRAPRSTSRSPLPARRARGGGRAPVSGRDDPSPPARCRGTGRRRRGAGAACGGRRAASCRGRPRRAEPLGEHVDRDAVERQGHEHLPLVRRQGSPRSRPEEASRSSLCSARSPGPSAALANTVHILRLERDLRPYHARLRSFTAAS